MKNFENGQNFWDERNCRTIEIIDFNGSDYYCKTVEGASDEDVGIEGYQWFEASELNGFKSVR